MLVIFFDFNGNLNGKMAKNYLLAIKSSRSVLQPSSYVAELHFYSSFQGYPIFTIGRTWPDGHKWPKWQFAIFPLKFPLK